MKRILTFDISTKTGWSLLEYDENGIKLIKNGVIDTSKLPTPQVYSEKSKKKVPFLSNPKRTIEFRKQVKKLLIRYQPTYVAKEALIIKKTNSAQATLTLVQLNVIWDDIMVCEHFKPIIVEANKWKDIFEHNGVVIKKNIACKDESIKLSNNLGYTCEWERARSCIDSDDIAEANLIGIYIIEKGYEKW